MGAIAKNREHEKEYAPSAFQEKAIRQVMGHASISLYLAGPHFFASGTFFCGECGRAN
jgi:hypothetical protein